MYHQPKYHLSTTDSASPADRDLQTAIFTGSHFLVKSALEKRANPNFLGLGSFGLTPLQRAIDRNHYMIVIELIRAGASLNILFPPGKLPLFHALKQKTINPSIVSYLIQQRAATDSRQDGKSVIQVALENQSCTAEIIGYLLQRRTVAGVLLENSTDGCGMFHWLATCGTVNTWYALNTILDRLDLPLSRVLCSIGIPSLPAPPSSHELPVEEDHILLVSRCLNLMSHKGVSPIQALLQGPRLNLPLFYFMLLHNGSGALVNSNPLHAALLETDDFYFSFMPDGHQGNQADRDNATDDTDHRTQGFEAIDTEKFPFEALEDQELSSTLTREALIEYQDLPILDTSLLDAEKQQSVRPTTFPTIRRLIMSLGEPADWSRPPIQTLLGSPDPQSEAHPSYSNAAIIATALIHHARHFKTSPLESTLAPRLGLLYLSTATQCPNGEDDISHQLGSTPSRVISSAGTQKTKTECQRLTYSIDELRSAYNFYLSQSIYYRHQVVQAIILETMLDWYLYTLLATSDSNLPNDSNHDQQM